MSITLEHEPSCCKLRDIWQKRKQRGSRSTAETRCAADQGEKWEPSETSPSVARLEESHLLPGWVQDGFCSYCCPGTLICSLGSVPAQPCGSPPQGDQRHLPPAQPAWPPHPFHQDQPHLGCFWLGQTRVKRSAVTCLSHLLPLCCKMATEARCAVLERCCPQFLQDLIPQGSRLASLDAVIT